MSVGNESIYELIPKPAVQEEKKPLYRSRHDPLAPPTASTFGRSVASATLETNVGGETTFEPAHPHKGPHAHFGPKVSQKPHPKNFVKKKKQQLPKKGRFVYSDMKKPPLPKASEGPAPSMGTQPVNFIKANATAVIGAAPPAGAEAPVNFLNKPDFGKVPAYLGQVKQQVSMETQLVQTMMNAQQESKTAGPKMRQLSEEERQVLLGNLKKKWDEINKLYQGCTHIIALDSRSKIVRKEQYERELAELEVAIERLSKKYVFVED